MTTPERTGPERILEENGRSIDLQVFHGRPFPVFLRYAASSAAGLIAITTASLVDGFFVGHYVGSDALASINLLIPLLTFWFASVLMIAIGGSVRAGAHLGQGQLTAASKTFSQNLLLAVAIGGVFSVAGHYADTALFRLLGAPDALIAILLPYFHILLLGLPLQFAAVVLYYFLRASGQPGRASFGLMAGAGANIVLDILLVGVLDLGIAGAAWATVAAQGIQCLLLALLFFRYSPLRFTLRKLPLGEFRRTLGNGTSEFINEMSAGIVIATVNWLVLMHFGIAGVAAFAVINYIQFTCLMLCYGFVDSLHVLVSQNTAAGNEPRARHFFYIAAASVLTLGAGLLVFLLLAYPAIVDLFLPQATPEQTAISRQLISWVWPVFLILGLNLCSNAYLTATGRALHSAILTLARSLILPVSLLLLFGLILERKQFLIALPLAEVLTLMAILLVLRSQTSRPRPLEVRTSC